jgi:putative restriction endonuclease
VQETLQKYLLVFKNLKRGVTKFGPAPHKPILLLSVIQAIRNNQIKDNRIYVTPELIFLFKSNWNGLVQTQNASTFALPFFHLHKEKSKFWNLVPKPGFEAILRMKESISSLSELNNMIEYAFLPDDLFHLLKDEVSNLVVQNFLMETYFPTATKSILTYPTNDLDELQDKVLNESPEIYKQEIKELIEQKNEDEIFLRGSLFKREIPKIYNNTCCISGMRIDATVNVSMIDACHIVPFSESYDDTVTNGIALCPNLHRAFDRGLIAIDKHYKVVVSKVFKEDDTSYGLKCFEDKEINLPSNKNYMPVIDNFNWHLNNIFKK